MPLPVSSILETSFHHNSYTYSNNSQQRRSHSRITPYPPERWVDARTRGPTPRSCNRRLCDPKRHNRRGQRLAYQLQQGGLRQ